MAERADDRLSSGGAGRSKERLRPRLERSSGALDIRIVSTTAPSSKKGNRVTAHRWAALLRQLGHRAHVEPQYSGGGADLLVALHAKRSFGSVQAYRRDNPAGRVIVALTGTDLYGDIHHDLEARRALAQADLLVALQKMAFAEVPEAHHSKLRIVLQSARAPAGIQAPDPAVLEVCVLGHLRPVKDPFRTAEAARLLPPSSRIRVLHVGAPLSADMEARARREQASNPR
jgi:hypothetical protein